MPPAITFPADLPGEAPRFGALVGTGQRPGATPRGWFGSHTGGNNPKGAKMRRVRVVNLTRQQTLAENAEVAESFLRRGIGLLGRSDWSRADGLVILPSDGVHSFFMKLTIDVVHLAKDGTVKVILPGLRPWRIGSIIWGGHAAIELPAGTCERTGTVVGDQIAILDRLEGAAHTG